MKIKGIILILSILLILISISPASAIADGDNSTYSCEMDVSEEEIITAPIEENDTPTLGYGIYNSLNNEPSWIVNDFEIKVNKFYSNNNVEVFLYFDGISQVTEFTLETYPAYIVENEKIIGQIPTSSVSNTNYPTTYPTPYSFNATFNYTIKNYDTQLKIRLCSLDSNTLVFQKNPFVSQNKLNNDSIIIINENGEIITSNSGWTNSFDFLESAIKITENNGTIYLNDINIYSNKKYKNGIDITKNITIVGNNVRINGFDNDNLFNIKSNVTFKNIIFENTFDYLINVENTCIFDNCTFTNTYEKAINNNGKVKIINSKFSDINAIYKLSKITGIDNIACIINNQNELEIINTTFDNIIMPHKIIINNNTTKEIGKTQIIYNSNNASINITNSSFNLIDGDLIANFGKISINNSNFTKIETIIPNIEINLDNKVTFLNINAYSYNFEWDDDILTGPIYSTNFISIDNSNFNNISLKSQPQNFSSRVFCALRHLADNKWYTLYIKLAHTMNVEGGVVYNTGTLIISQSKIENTKATSAGAIYNTGNAKINKTTTNKILAYSGTGGVIINKGLMNISNSYFNDSTLEITHTYRAGGCIYNSGTINIENTTMNKTSGSKMRGGAIFNDGELNITRSAIIDSSAYDEGGAIFNDGTANINTVLFEKCSGTYGIVTNRENKTTTIYNSSFIDCSIGSDHEYPSRYLGMILNKGNMVVNRNIIDFRHYTPEDSSGTYGIYNIGNIIITHNLFLNTTTYAVDRWGKVLRNIQIYIMNEGGSANIDNNYFDVNTNPYNNFSTEIVGRYFILDIEPEYSPLQIGEKTNITATLKLDTGRYYKNYNLLPNMIIEFTVIGKNDSYVVYVPLIDGKASIEFNKSEFKGSYNVTAKLGYCIKDLTVDIGKNYSQMDVEAEEINYGENATFYMTITGNLTHQPQGSVTVIIDGEKYSTKIKNTKASITIPDLKPKTYDLIIRYEGDEDYFKSIFHKNYTVHKRPTNMTMTIPEINYGEVGIATITLKPENAAIQAYMYITNEKNETSKKTIYLRNVTDIKLKNFAGGEYNITVVLWENLKYESSNATAIFKVNKFPTNLTINASDINAGETQILNITLSPKGEVAGEAILQINNHTEIIFLKNGANNVVIENLAGGSYNVTVTFPGDKKYAASSASTRFTVKKLQTNIIAKIENNILYINTTPNSTGKVQIFINDDIYEVNLTNSQATLPVNFTKAENYIFIYYQGDGYYNYTTCNLTYEYEELLNLTGYDETFYNTENATYYLTLTDEEGYGIADRTIILKINDDVFEYITGNDGSITVPLNPTVGEYKITAQYRNRTSKNTVTILEDAFITGNDTQAYTHIDFTYAVELKDHLGKAIANVKITFTVDGKTYTNKTNGQGIAVLTLNLKGGNYNITTQYRTVIHTNNIYVGDILLKGNDLTIYNTENGTYELSLTDKNGKGVSNQTISITLNNKTYTKTTDEKGKTSLNIKLDTGNYKITAQFNDQKIINKITVLEDAFLSVNNTKAYENVDFKHVAILTDHNGKGIVDAEITFKINGKTYTNKTNDKGLAVLTLNLREGNYTITSTYKNITKTAKIIIVDDSHLVGNDVKAYSGTDFKYNVKLIDHNNKGIEDVTITFKINGKTYTNKTDVNGQTTLTFNLETGNYTIITSYKNRTIENNFEIIEDYILTGNDIKAYADTNFTYKVKLTDHNGKTIKNAEITFTLNGKIYTNKTDVNGEAIITLSLKTGNYEVTVRYRNTTTTNTLIIIEDYILTGNDIKAFAEDDFTYKVNLTDHNAKAIKNAEIIFKINGKTYTNKTNEKGLATLTLNLKEGNYTITAKYKNTTAANELEIIENHILTGQNVKAYEDTDFTYTVTLTRTDGTPIADKEITFIINNKRFTNITDSNGKASKTLNLPEGNYTITSIYKNTRITNNLTIIEDYNLEGNNIHAYAEKDFTYKVNLTDHNKKAVKNVEVTFEINGQIIKNKTDANGQAVLTLNLKKGNYTITTTYINIKKTNKLEIVETYQLTGINVKSYENFDFEYIVTLKNHNDKAIENAEITFEINGQTYKNKTDADGKVKLTLNLKKGNYTIKTTYNDISTTNKLEIIEYDLERIISEDIEMYYHDGTRFKIQLLNQTTQLVNKTVQIIINGATYTRTTDDNGSASIGLNLNAGRYRVTTKYDILEKNNTLTIKSTIKGNDITKVFKNSTQYYATFYNSKGELLKNTDVTFNINGVFYTRTTNENGTARMNINLPQGTYTITATNPETKEQHSNTVTVISKIQENNDLTKYYRNASQYTLKIIDEKGNPAKAGQKVTFNINGVFYERYTNESGYVKMNINLQPGTYIITAEYEGCRVSNTIKVLPVLKAEDLTMKYKDGSKFKATLVDSKGKPYANQEVIFNINGVFYTRNTDENGIAQLNINLMSGKYIITSSYNGSNTANTIKIE